METSQWAHDVILIVLVGSGCFVILAPFVAWIINEWRDRG